MKNGIIDLENKNERKNEMKEELGYWKGTKVFAILKDEYEKSNQNIYVIWDDGRQVVFDGMVIGKLDNSGYITEVKHKAYKKPTASYKEKEKKEPKPQEEKVVGSDADYYAQFSKVVDEFFASLSVGEEKKEYDIKITLGERKQLW